MSSITLRGVRTHNLKNINVDFPRNQVIIVTGLSGSGKSSLAFDTLYAEGQRRYVESLSAYARQFLSMMEKPDVESRKRSIGKLMAKKRRSLCDLVKRTSASTKSMKTSASDGRVDSLSLNL